MEDPTSFVWTIDWEDVELHKQWINHPDYKAFIGVVAEAFDLEAGPPFFCRFLASSSSQLVYS